MSFVQVQGESFAVDNNKIVFRGFGIGTWMNTEHFMTRLPGTDHRKRQMIESVYGKEQTEIFYERYLQNFISESDFIFLKKLGVNMIRLPFSYRYFEDDLRPGDYKDSGFKHLDRVLALCEKYEIYAILDLHAAPGGQNPDSHADTDLGVSGFWHDRSCQDRVVGMWKFIAKHYKNNTWIAAYDLLNEPVYVPNAAVFNDFYDRTIDAIRQVDPNHVLILEGDHWAQDFSKLNTPQDPNIAYSFHFYPMYSVKGVEDWNRSHIEKDLGPLIDKLREQFGRPLWCGETGSGYKPETIQASHDLVKITLDILEEREVSWTLWTYKDAKAMGLMYPKTESGWMSLVRRVDFDHQSEHVLSDKVFDLLEQEPQFKPISEEDRFRLAFRIRGAFHDLFLNQCLKPALEQIPFEEFLTYADSFLWEQCEYYPEIAELFKSYTKKLV
jgi:endoglucanase